MIDLLRLDRLTDNLPRLPIELNYYKVFLYTIEMLFTFCFNNKTISRLLSLAHLANYRNKSCPIVFFQKKNQHFTK